MQAELRLVDENGVGLQAGRLQKQRGQTDEAKRSIRELQRTTRRIRIVFFEPLHFHSFTGIVPMQKIFEERRDHLDRLDDGRITLRVLIAKHPQKWPEV